MSQIIGDAELKRKLKKLQNLESIYKDIFAAGVHVYGKVSKYPPAPPKNKTPGGSWYDRGYGSRWMRKDGTIGGRMTSEDLGPSWTAKGEKGTRVVIGNDTSYGKWVQDPDYQSRVMKRIGWKTTDDVVKEEKETVLKMIKKAVDRELAKG